MKKTTKKKDAKNSFRFSSVYHFIARAFLIGFLGVLFCTLTLLVLYVGDLFINVMSGNSKKPLFGAYVIMSGSMVPTIQVKDGIVVRRVANDSYQVGDIITFSPNNTRYGNATITHRIIEKREVKDGESLYTTKGDHNFQEDASLVSTADIYGKVLFRIPKIGYIQEFFSRPSNYFSCILGFSLIFILYYSSKVFVVFLKEKKA